MASLSDTRSPRPSPRRTARGERRTRVRFNSQPQIYLVEVPTAFERKREIRSIDRRLPSPLKKDTDDEKEEGAHAL